MGKWKKKKKTKRKRRGISQEQKRKAPPFLKALYDRATSQMGKSQRRDYGIEKLLICSVADDAILPESVIYQITWADLQLTIMVEANNPIEMISALPTKNA
ncbi:hypothetical protein N7530_001340 [Penicillium desertorum]|uniref:Uncharacterized protein n=1 Tax=Penicillium desertorum TaxID=1303715 RepID=A0A9W9X9Z4_9EURO|nr:hypothetical protein N7530_001340 [Penicillium desertorum]